MAELTYNEAYAEKFRSVCPGEAQPLLLLGFNRQRTDPRKRVDGLCVFGKDGCRVFEDGALVATVPTEAGGRYRLTDEVGCCILEFITPTGEYRLVCRSDNAHRAELSVGAKYLNRAVEFGENLSPDSVPLLPEKPGPESRKWKKNTVKQLWQMLRPYRPHLAATVCLFLVTTGMGLLLPYLNRRLVDGYIQGTSNVDSAFWLGFVAVVISIFAVGVVQRVIGAFRGQILLKAGNGLICTLRETVFEKIQKMSVARVSKRTAGELMDRINSDTTVIRDFITGQFASLIEQILLFVFVLAVLLSRDVGLTGLILASSVFVVVPFRIFWKYMSKLFRRSWVYRSRMSTALHDIFSGIRVVKAFGMEKKETEHFKAASDDVSENAYRIETFWAFFNPLANFFIGVGEFVLLYYVGSMILQGKMTYGEMSQFSAYASMIYGPLGTFLNMPRQIMQTSTSVNKVFEVINEVPDIKDAEDPKEIALSGAISVRNVSFGYEGGGDVLRNVSLEIEPGEFIGIVGRSGVGKSTLINLIMRMYDPEAGSICVDGVDLREISQRCLRSQIGVVLQETFLFSGTVYDNIAYAAQDATPESVMRVAKMAGAHEFIMRLGDGYETKIGEHGYTLSGGERQRIAIARALLHNPRILILDEATASLDTESEKQIQETVASLSHDRTTIAIAHRLSTLRNATRLVVLDKGSVAETGTHDELMEKHGIYYGLVMAQREMSKMDNE